MSPWFAAGVCIGALIVVAYVVMELAHNALWNRRRRREAESFKALVREAEARTRRGHRR